MPTAGYILGSLAVVFLLFGLTRLARSGGRIDGASRSWLTIAVIFGAVTVWLWLSRKR